MARLSSAGLVLAGVDGLMAVAAGAFGAHGVADPGVKALLQTGAQYQLVHAVAAVVLLTGPLRDGPARWSGPLFAIGGLLFGGSLYVLALTGVRALGAVTPLGGLLMLAGWTCVIWGALAKMD